MKITAVVLVLAGVLSLAACVTLDPVKDFRAHTLTRASFELQCPPDRLLLTKIPDDSSIVGVQGCGKRAVFIYAGGVQWVNDSGPVPESAH